MEAETLVDTSRKERGRTRETLQPQACVTPMEQTGICMAQAPAAACVVT